MKADAKKKRFHEDLVGLDIGEQFICAAHYRRRRGKPLRLHKADILEVEPGASDLEISRALRALWRRAGFHTYTVAVCFRNPVMVVKNCRFPNLQEDELAPAIQVEAEISLQRPVDAIVYDWYQSPGAEGSPCEGILIASPRRDVERQVSILQNAGLYPVIMDAPCLALAALKCSVQQDRAESLCLIHERLHHLEVAILYADNSLYVRSLYARSLTEDNGVELVIQTLQEAVRYTEFTLHKPAIDRVQFMGFSAREEACIRGIQESIGIPVERWNPLADVGCPPSLTRRLEKRAENAGAIMSIALSLGARRFQ